MTGERIIKIISSFSELKAFSFQVESAQACSRMKRDPYQDTSLWNSRTFLQASIVGGMNGGRGENGIMQRIRNQTLLLLQRATLGARRKSNNLIKILKENYFQFQLLYSAKLSIESKVSKKTFSDISCLTSTSHILLLGSYQNKNVNQERKTWNKKHRKSITGEK